jgi:hypothetical protein
MGKCLSLYKTLFRGGAVDREIDLAAAIAMGGEGARLLTNSWMHDIVDASGGVLVSDVTNSYSSSSSSSSSSDGVGGGRVGRGDVGPVRRCM